MQRKKLARPTPSPTEGEATAVAAVLDNVDLLMLILLLLGFPTSLIRAALVCRRWYRVASDPDFLRRFRQLHPPRLLGFYSDMGCSVSPKFVPLAEAPELTTAVRCASSLAMTRFSIRDCWRDGRLLVKCYDAPTRTSGLQVHRPLHPTRGVAIIPLRPLTDFTNYRAWFFLSEDGSQDGVMITEAFLDSTSFKAKVCTFQSGIWTCLTTEADGLLFPDPEASHSIQSVLRPVRGKMYMKVNSRSILELDLVAASVSVVQLPDAVNTDNYKLSCGEDSGLHLVHANGSLLTIWRKTSSNNGPDDWVLVDDAIRVREAYNRNEDVTVFVVDSNLEYVFLGLKTTGFLVSMHLKTRIERVYGQVKRPHYGIEYRVVPFMMIWPPIFPALREEKL